MQMKKCTSLQHTVLALSVDGALVRIKIGTPFFEPTHTGTSVHGLWSAVWAGFQPSLNHLAESLVQDRAFTAVQIPVHILFTTINKSSGQLMAPLHLVFPARTNSEGLDGSGPEAGE